MNHVKVVVMLMITINIFCVLFSYILLEIVLVVAIG